MDRKRNPRNITVDDREVKSGIVGLLEDRGWAVQVRRLACGDFRIGREALIEKKTGLDYSVSVVDGRLFRQVAKMRNLGMRIAVLVEGNPFQRDYSIDAEAVRGAVVSVSLIWQVPVIFSESLPQTVEILGYMADQVHRLTDLPPARPGYRPKRLRRRQFYVLQSLPGIGPKRALGLLNRFGTLRRIFQATEKEWVQADGIGRKGAKNIAALLDANFFSEDPADFRVENNEIHRLKRP